VKRLRLIYEQLEEAKGYLLRGSLFNIRLALILTDNVGELLMFNALEKTFSRDEWLRPLRKNAEEHGILLDPILQPKYSAEERARAEREFEPMVRLLQHRLSELPAADATVLRIAHRLRRDAFHKGQLREDILTPIVRLLFKTVVGLTQSLRFADVVQVFPLDAEDKAFLRRFEVRDDHFDYSEETKNKFAAKLVEGAEFDLESFRTALKDDLIGRNEALLNQLTAFYDDAQINVGLLQYQFWQENVAQDKKLDCSAFDGAFAVWRKSAIPLVTVEWLRQFQQVVPRKLNSRYPSQVLASYWGMNEELSPKEDLIEQHISDLDSAIQLEIDIARGK
jgi:hypothetical protein